MTPRDDVKWSRPRPSVARSIIAPCTGAFLVLATAVLGGADLGDRTILAEVHDAVGTSLDEPMLAIGRATDTVVLGAVTIIVCASLALRARLLDAVRSIAVVGGTFTINPLLKEVFARDRPDLRPLPENVSGFAFPSGHASGTAALISTLVLLAPARHRKIVASAGVLVLLAVGLSRVVLSVHYPTDVLAGWIWVTAFALLVWGFGRAALFRGRGGK